jgi:hypothetical protein|uniref:Uncharacterized protein n=1 Tax=Bionectria ochroleuca TaxID=29856 RepID=A0A8H7KBP0_BIOOC
MLFRAHLLNFPKSKQKILQCFARRRHHKILGYLQRTFVCMPLTNFGFLGFRQRIIYWVHTVHKSVWEQALPVCYFESAQSLDQLLTSRQCNASLTSIDPNYAYIKDLLRVPTE